MTTLELTEIQEPPNTKSDLILSEELAKKGATFTPVELKLPDGMSLADWRDIGRKLGLVYRTVEWWIGDWVVYGAEKYGALKPGDLDEFAASVGLAPKTVHNYASVCRSVHNSLRRENIDFSIYKELAPLKPKHQIKWIRVMEKEKITVSELRRRIRRDLAEEPGHESDGPVFRFITKMLDDVLIRLNSIPKELWTEERRAKWRIILEPLVRFYEGLGSPN